MQLPVNKLGINNQDDVFFCRSGYEVNLNDDVWVLDKNRKLYFAKLKEILGPDEFSGLKNTLKHYAIFYSSYHTINMSTNLLRYLTYCQCNQINAASR